MKTNYSPQKTQTDNKEDYIIYHFSEEEVNEIKEKFKKEDNTDIIDFLKRTREWRNAPSSNGHKRLRGVH